MAQVSKNLKPGVSAGMRTLIAFINSHNKAKIVEISKEAVPFKIMKNDPNFDLPESRLNIEY